MDNNHISQGRLKEILHYSQDTGVFTWLKKSPRGVKEGAIAGTLCPATGYTKIQINYRAYGCHRLAFLYMTGSVPEQVDHINHDRSDNRWTNLREAEFSVNSKNKSLDKRNKTGFSGVEFVKTTGKFRARFNYEGKWTSLGTFNDLESAVRARKEAEKNNGYHENHGMIKSAG
ncbi:MAG TPA: HNH endonuclease [Gammaproteobacteria bacterium]|nr:HNH endonuclease [Gammaproteobacteria bacterium]